MAPIVYRVFSHFVALGSITLNGSSCISTSMATTVISRARPVMGSSTCSRHTLRNPRPQLESGRPVPNAPREYRAREGSALSLWEVLKEPCCSKWGRFRPRTPPSTPSLSMSRLLVRPACSLAPLLVCSSSSAFSTFSLFSSPSPCGPKEDPPRSRVKRS